MFSTKQLWANMNIVSYSLVKPAGIGAGDLTALEGSFILRKGSKWAVPGRRLNRPRELFEMVYFKRLQASACPRMYLQGSAP